MTRIAMDHEIGPLLSVVVPLYNEEALIGRLHERIAAVLSGLDGPCEMVFVDDGSRDATAELLDRIQRDDPDVSVVHLSRNFGHQAAVTAGLDHARGRAIVVMDGDGQDPPELIPAMLGRWLAGVDVVYAVRKNRKEHPLRRLAYASFYRLWSVTSDLEIPLDSGDFSLMDRRVVDALQGLPERVRFVRGLRTFVGFRQEALPYDRPARVAGRSKYSFGKMIAFATDGLISFSGRPLRLMTFFGLGTALAALATMAWALCDAFGDQTAPRGWASLIAVVLWIGSVQMLGLGILGEYVRLIFLETKGRPSYIVGDYRSSHVHRPHPTHRRRRRTRGGTTISKNLPH